MRELHAISSILAKALKRARESNRRIQSLQLGLGELFELDPQSIQQRWDELSKGTAAERSELHFRFITAEVQCMACFEKYQPVGVFHLAAESHVDRSIVSADDFVQTNVVGTYTMLEAARAYWNTLPDELKKEFRFLHVSTDEVFGSLGEDGYFTEETPYAPQNPYSASKAASDHFVRAFHHT